MDLSPHTAGPGLRGCCCRPRALRPGHLDEASPLFGSANSPGCYRSPLQLSRCPAEHGHQGRVAEFGSAPQNSSLSVLQGSEREAGRGHRLASCPLKNTVLACAAACLESLWKDCRNQFKVVSSSAGGWE